MSTIATKYGYDKKGNRNMVIDPKENVTYFNYDLQGRLRSTISPDGNIAYYEYNKVGNVTSKKDENGNVINYAYDKLYRIIRKDYPDSTHAYFSYDAAGKRLHMQDPNTLTYFTYACGCGNRLATVHDCILDKWISYTYDKIGRRDSMTDPEGDVIYYDYDSVKLIRIKRNTDEEAYYAYDAGGRRNYTVLGNNSYTYYDYDINGRLKRVANHKSDDSVISTFDYTLDPVGNRIAMELASGDTVYYEYDGIYQLVKEDRRADDDSLVYINYFEYDLAGNRTHLHYVDSGTDDWTYYTYNIENQLTIEETGGTATYYEYDAAGALLRKDVSGTISYYEYNYDGLMDRFNEGETVATYTFDTDSRRIEKDVDGTVSKFEYNGADVVAEYDGDDVLQATFNTPSIDYNLTQKRSGNVYHYLQDGLGSVRNLIDANEVIKNIYDYFAFGGVYGSPTETISNPFRFTGRRWDSESSLHFYRARMMDQTLGRFLSKDPIFNANSYLYVLNNPTVFSDPDGLFIINTVLPTTRALIDLIYTLTPYQEALYQGLANISGPDQWTGPDWWPDEPWQCIPNCIEKRAKKYCPWAKCDYCYWACYKLRAERRLEGLKEELEPNKQYPGAVEDIQLQRETYQNLLAELPRWKPSFEECFPYGNDYECDYECIWIRWGIKFPNPYFYKVLGTIINEPPMKKSYRKKIRSSTPCKKVKITSGADIKTYNLYSSLELGGKFGDIIIDVPHYTSKLLPWVEVCFGKKQRAIAKLGDEGQPEYYLDKAIRPFELE